MNIAKNSTLASTWISFLSSRSITSMVKYCRSQALRDPRAAVGVSSSLADVFAPSPSSPLAALAAPSASIAASSIVSLIHATTPNTLSTVPNPRSSHKYATSSLATFACFATPIVANPSTHTGASSIALRMPSMIPRASRSRRSAFRRTASSLARLMSSPFVVDRVAPPNAFFVPNLFAVAAAVRRGFGGDNRAIARCRSASLANRASRDDDTASSVSASSSFDDVAAARIPIRIGAVRVSAAARRPARRRDGVDVDDDAFDAFDACAHRGAAAHATTARIDVWRCVRRRRATSIRSFPSRDMFATTTRVAASASASVTSRARRRCAIAPRRATTRAKRSDEPDARMMTTTTTTTTSTFSATRMGERARRGDAQRARFLKKFFSRDEPEDETAKTAEDSVDEGEAEAPTRADAETTTTTMTDDAPVTPALAKPELKTTLSDLNALLGIDEDAERRAKEEEEEAFRASARASARTPTADETVVDLGASISPKALDALKNAESARKGLSAEKGDELEKALSELSEIAKKGKTERDAGEIESQFSKLLDILEEPEEPAIAAGDVERMKKELFGMQTFYVTAVENLGAEMNGAGVLFKGNLRAERAGVWEATQSGLEKMFGGKYTAFMLEEPTEGGAPGGDVAIDSKFGPRVSFLIVPSDRAGPNPGTTGWQYFLALALMGLTVASAVQLGLVAEISKLPPETMSWLQQAGEVDLPEGALPPGLENFDSVAYVEAALPISIGVLASTVGHEIGHQIAAYMRKIKIGIPFLIPNGQLGTFGTVTQLKSTPETRADLFDVAAAGPVAGSMVALNLFVYGLTLSMGGDNADLVPIPAALFNSSLLLGGFSQLFLTASAKGVLVHPYFIAGWCALTTQALNLLPVGSIDGGRMTQAAFGRRVLGATSLGTYIGLAFGVIASSLSLPWAIYLVLTQRTPEFAPKDDVTEVDDARARLAFVMTAVAFLILLPSAPDVGVDQVQNIL